MKKKIAIILIISLVLGLFLSFFFVSPKSAEIDFSDYDPYTLYVIFAEDDSIPLDETESYYLFNFRYIKVTDCYSSDYMFNVITFIRSVIPSDYPLKIAYANDTPFNIYNFTSDDFLYWYSEGWERPLDDITPDDLFPEHYWINYMTYTEMVSHFIPYVYNNTPFPTAVPFTPTPRPSSTPIPTATPTVAPSVSTDVDLGIWWENDDTEFYDSKIYVGNRWVSIDLSKYGSYPYYLVYYFDSSFSNYEDNTPYINGNNLIVWIPKGQGNVRVWVLGTDIAPTATPSPTPVVSSDSWFIYVRDNKECSIGKDGYIIDYRIKIPLVDNVEYGGNHFDFPSSYNGAFGASDGSSFGYFKNSQSFSSSNNTWYLNPYGYILSSYSGQSNSYIIYKRDLPSPTPIVTPTPNVTTTPVPTLPMSTPFPTLAPFPTPIESIEGGKNVTFENFRDYMTGFSDIAKLFVVPFEFLMSLAWDKYWLFFMLPFFALIGFFIWRN